MKTRNLKSNNYTQNAKSLLYFMEKYNKPSKIYLKKTRNIKIIIDTHIINLP
jgi:hypothetical protein